MPGTVGTFHRRNFDSRRASFAAAHNLAPFLMIVVVARSGAPGELHAIQN
jgi:hypothetical protein